MSKLFIKLFLAILTFSCCTSLNAEEFNLTILHNNDSHSHVGKTVQRFTIQGQQYNLETGGYEYLNPLIKKIKKVAPNTLTFHAGDAITSFELYNKFHGTTDVMVFNTVCYDAFTLGNHEFDHGDEEAANFINAIKESSCSTPTIVANIDPSKNGKLYNLTIPYKIFTVGNNQIGVIGILNGNKTKFSSNPDKETIFLDEVATAQKYIDELTQKGINKILLLTHNTYEQDLQLAKQLSGVDAIIGGDSHTLLGNSVNKLFNDAKLQPYPTVVNDLNDNKVCIVQAYQYAQVLGELNITFDDQGIVNNCGGQPHYILPHDSLDKLPNDIKNILKNNNEIYIAKEKDPQIEKILDYIKENSTSEIVIGNAETDIPHYYNLSSQSSSHGSKLCNIIGQSMIDSSDTYDFALLNSGAIRDNIYKGNITQNNIQSILPYEDLIVWVELSGKEVQYFLNQLFKTFKKYNKDAISKSLPCGGGIRFDINTNAPYNKIVDNIEIKNRTTGVWEPLNLDNTYKLVSIDFFINKKPIFSQNKKVNITKDLYIDPLLKYITNHKKISVPKDEDLPYKSFVLMGK